MAPFYSRLSYSFGNEDWRTEAKALDIKKDHHVVCITASGDRPLNLLDLEPAKITSIDANPHQNHLLELKRSALRTLDFDTYLDFLGVTNQKAKKLMPRKLYEDLPEESKNFWVKQMKAVEKGIIYQGEVEKVCKRIAQFIRIVRGYKVCRLTAFDDIYQQREFVAKTWDKPFWRKIFKIALNPKYSSLYIDDPGLYAHVKPGMNPGEYIYDRMTESLYNFLAKENPLFSLFLNGYVMPSAFAPHMIKESAMRIKSRLDKLETVTSNMIDYLENAPKESIDRFSFSDIASYMDEASFNRMLRAMRKCAKPGARFCIRQFLSDHTLELDNADHMQRDFALEQQLEKEDRCFIYRFIIGTIKH